MTEPTIQVSIETKPELLDRFRDTRWDRRESLAETVRGFVYDILENGADSLVDLPDPGHGSGSLNVIMTIDMRERASEITEEAGMTLLSAIRRKIEATVGVDA